MKHTDMAHAAAKLRLAEEVRPYRHVHRRPKKKDFEGKKITKFILQADNIWQFQFEDGSRVAIQSDNFGTHGLACMALCEECGKAA